MSQSRVDPALFAGFAQPNPEFSPVPIWWWSGESLDLDRMRWQIDQLVAQGVHNAVVLNLAPTGPIHGALSDDPHMGTDAWWEIWDELCSHAQAVGMRLWFYDQFGFSGANLQGRLAVANPDFVGLALDRVVAEVEGKGELACPDAGLPVAALALPLAADGSVAGPPVTVELRDGRARWSGPGRVRLMIAYTLRKGFDYHSPEACAALIDIVHGEFERRLGKYFGTSLVGSFQDELPSVPSWSGRFEREFEARCGYAVAPKLAALWEDWGPESAQVRADYQRVRAALAEEALFKPLFDWHDSRGLTFGVDQQSPARAGEPLGATDQYADYARTHRWYSAPGSDHWGNAKFHSSLAHSYGRPRTWIESFHSSGWGGTLEETFDWLQPWLLAGANLYNPHAVYYSTKGGQWEWAAPSTCWRQPYWRHYKHFADTIARLCWLATRGEHGCDIGLVYPSAAVQADIFLDHAGPKARAAHGAYMQLMGSMIWFNTQKGVLERLRRDFDVLDDDTLATATVEQGVLTTRAERYKALIVPNAWMIERRTLRTLLAFASAGGLLIAIDALPGAVAAGDGAGDLAALHALAREGRVTIVAGGEGLRERLKAALAPIERPVATDSPALYRRSGDVHMLFLTAAPEGSATAQPMLPWAIWDYDSDIFPMARYSSELREKGYDFDPARNRHTATVKLKGPVGAIEQWDPASGSRHPVQLRRGADATEVVIDFSGSPMSVLVWKHVGEADAAPLAPAAGPGLILGETWRSRIVPTIDNRYGDFTLPAHPGPLPVQAWSLGYREESAATPSPTWTEADWNDVAVTFGPRAWQVGPLPASELPAPLPEGFGGRLDAPGWEPVVYSLSRGVDHDMQHDRTLGPKGRVPEDFWRVRKVRAGEAVQFRTMLPAPPGPLTLAVGGNGRKTIWWNGTQLPADRGGYLHLSDVTSNGGLNLLELRVEAVVDDDLAGYWALTADRDAFERPEWLQPAGVSQAGTTIVVSKTVEIGAGETLEAQFASQGVATLMVNGTDVAMHGAFDPYAGWQMVRIIKYDLTRYLAPGLNTIAVRFTDIGKPISMLFDGVIIATPGSNRPRTIVSDLSWSAERDGRPVELALQSSQRNDPRYALLRARPHPLPRTGWLDPEQPLAGVLDIVPEARPADPKLYQWFALPVPPGATAIMLPAKDVELAVFANGTELPVLANRCSLPRPAPRNVYIRALARDGRHGGAIWDGPLEFDVGEGEIGLGPWSQYGLSFYSGGLAYEQQVTVDDPQRYGTLDLGAVRGTAEVKVNGTPAGVRVWSPYRFDVSGLLQPGANTITVEVFNTLAPYLKGASPSRTIFKGQDVSGMMGPVMLS